MHGSAILVMAFSVSGYNNDISKHVLLPTISVFLSISHICFMSNVIPFGLDQLQGASYIHYASFFYWWYWTLSIGVIANVPHCSDEHKLGELIQTGSGLLCITIALIFDALFKHWYIREPCSTGQENPLRQIAMILRYVINPPAGRYIPSMVCHELDFSNYS